jgi:hypothetical protein
MHMRRYFFKALDSDQAHTWAHRASAASDRPHVCVEERARGLSGEERLELRKRLSTPVMEKLHPFLLRIREEVLKEPGRTGRALRAKSMGSADQVAGRRRSGD